MKSLSLLPVLAVLLLVVSLPPTAARSVMLRIVGDGTSPYVECGGGGGVYAANSTYEANRRRLAGLLLADAASRSSYYTERAVGYWPNRPQGTFFCPRRGVDRTGTGSGSGPGSSSCAACVTGALLELERACPYHREANFYSSNCTLEFSEFRIFEGTILKQVLSSGLIFQAVGFAWLFFLLLQEWRSRKRGTLMHSTPLLSGD